MGQSICPYFLPTFAPLELTVSSFLPFPAHPLLRARASHAKVRPRRERHDATFTRSYLGQVVLGPSEWLLARESLSSVSLFGMAGRGSPCENEAREREEAKKMLEASFSPLLPSSRCPPFPLARLPVRPQRGEEGGRRTGTRRGKQHPEGSIISIVPKYTVGHRRSAARSRQRARKRERKGGCSAGNTSDESSG
jgi:hypothetical protein